MTDSLAWIAQSAEDVPADDYWLSEAERRLLNGMRFAKRRHDWRLGRWTAKLGVRTYRHEENLSLSLLEIRAAAGGFPEVFCDGRSLNVSLSLSHSRNRGFCALGPGNLAVGCDVEFVEPRDHGLVEDYFLPEEIAFLQQIPNDEQALVINLIWSAKESSLKVLREGLRRDPRSISVHLDFEDSGASWNKWYAHCLDSARVFHGWWKSAAGYVYTIASDRATSVPIPLSAY